MNYENMWAIVDSHRRCADELERTIREVTGDRPVRQGGDIARGYKHDTRHGPQALAEQEPDRIDLYRILTQTLNDASFLLQSVAMQEGKPREPRKTAAACNTVAKRCDRARRSLESVGEL